MTDHRLPASLGEAIAAPGHICPIPYSHDRLNECHYWWHQMARNYHEPEPFRYSLGAFVQAARNVTFMLQSEKSAFDDFSWYDEWVKEARKSEAMLWLQEARTNIVHREALQARSWMRERCIRRKDDPYYGDEDNVGYYKLNPFMCTHYYIHEGDAFVEATGGENHSHEILRNWEMQELPGREVLDLAAEIYGILGRLLRTAHQRANSSMRTAERSAGEITQLPEDDALPCMRNTKQYRIARIKQRKGKSIWTNEPPDLHAG